MRFRRQLIALALALALAVGGIGFWMYYREREKNDVSDAIGDLRAEYRPGIPKSPSRPEYKGAEFFDEEPSPDNSSGGR